MTNKVYRTHQGKVLDIGALVLRNENVRAVGNMNVNAKGDRVDADNKSIDSKQNQVNRQYKRQASNVVKGPAPMSSQYQQAPTPSKKAAKEPKIIPPPPEDFDDDFQKPIDKPPVTQTAETSTKSSTSRNKIPEGGLAAAIARARKIEQQPIESKTSGRSRPGVSKI
jgi:hypothetical protein